MSQNSGSKATFVITIQNDQNATWQGTINWIEHKKNLAFRSALEMIKLIDGALMIEKTPCVNEKPQISKLS